MTGQEPNAGTELAVRVNKAEAPCLLVRSEPPR